MYLVKHLNDTEQVDICNNPQKSDCEFWRIVLLKNIRQLQKDNSIKIRSKGEPVNISRGMMETMRETPHGNSISSFSTSPLSSQTRLEQRAQVG